MALSQAASKAKLKLLERFFPDASEAQAETFEILMDLEQIGTLLGSMDEMRRGHVVSFKDAFADL